MQHLKKRVLGVRGGLAPDDRHLLRVDRAAADRGPRELLELATPDQAERFVAPVVRGRVVMRRGGFEGSPRAIVVAM